MLVCSCLSDLEDIIIFLQQKLIVQAYHPPQRPILENIKRKTHMTRHEYTDNMLVFTGNTEHLQNVLG